MSFGGGSGSSSIAGSTDVALNAPANNQILGYNTSLAKWQNQAQATGGGTESVLDYGATGDGVTDDTTAINAAITAAVVGATVLIPHGKTFMVNADYNAGKAIRPKSGVNIRIEGTLQAITNTVANSAVILSENKSNFTITGSGTILGERLTHVGSTGEGGMCVRIEGGANIAISGLALKNGFGDGLYVGIFGAGPGTEAKGLRVSGVRVANNRRNGVSVTGGIGITFTGCTFEDTNGTDPQAGIDLEPNVGTIVRAVTITGNTFRNNFNYGVQTTANTSDVTITGNVFDGSHAITAIRLAGTDTVVASNTIRGGTKGIYAGIAARSTITGNRVNGTTDRGIDVSWSDDSTITGNAVTDTNKAGIYLRGQANFTCTGNIVSRCGGTTDNGITAAYGSGYINGNGIIADNVVTNAALHGIQCAMPNVHIHDNMITGASSNSTGVSYGIYVLASTTTDCLVNRNVLRVGSAGQQVQYGIMIATGVLRTEVLDNNFGPGSFLTANIRNDGTP